MEAKDMEAMWVLAGKLERVLDKQDEEVARRALVVALSARGTPSLLVDPSEITMIRTMNPPPYGEDLTDATAEV